MHNLTGRDAHRWRGENASTHIAAHTVHLGAGTTSCISKAPDRNRAAVIHGHGAIHIDPAIKHDVRCNDTRGGRCIRVDVTGTTHSATTTATATARRSSGRCG